MGLLIMMYHSVPEDGIAGNLALSKIQLIEHFLYLRDEGYTPISLSQFMEHQQDQSPLPPKPVLITFDDSFNNSNDLACTFAHMLNIKADLFLVPPFIVRDTQPESAAACK